MSKQLPAEVSRAVPKSRTGTVSPQLYRVLMHNDDYTTMEFVVRVLETLFRKSTPEAHRIMLNIHVKGVGVCGVFPFEVAETKVEKVHALARNEGFPLRCSMEEA